MKRILCIGALFVYSSTVGTQPSELEIRGLENWECVPYFSATGNQLTLHREPDLRSETIVIPYGRDWRIPAPRSGALTRILSFGSLRVIAPDEEMYCPVQPTDDKPELQPGQLVDFLYRQVEGHGVIRVSGAQCVVRAGYEELFEVVEEPEVQEWLRVYFADDTSPGWLLNDQAQAQVYRCGG